MADIFSMQDRQKLLMESEEFLSGTRFHEYNLAEVDLQKQGKELMKAAGLNQTELWEVQDETVFWWNYLDETCQQSEAETRSSFLTVMNGGWCSGDPAFRSGIL